jgi:hypothetical protein
VSAPPAPAAPSRQRPDLLHKPAERVGGRRPHEPVGPRPHRPVDPRPPRRIAAVGDVPRGLGDIGIAPTVDDAVVAAAAVAFAFAAAAAAAGVWLSMRVAAS